MSDIRTPSSLKWLLDKRARLMGEIAKLEGSHPKRIEETKRKIASSKKSLEQARKKLTYLESSGPFILESLRADLQAIDFALGLHEIQINPDIIPPIHTQDAERELSHGGMSRGIFECFRRNGGAPLTTIEITYFVAAKAGMVLTNENFQLFRVRIKDRLKTLCAEGKLKRLHQVKGAVIGRWVN